MKQLLSCLAIACLVVGFSSLRSQNQTFIERIGVGSMGIHRDLIALPSGDLVMAGVFGLSNEGFLARFDQQGQLIWGGTLPTGMQFNQLIKGPGESFFACGTRDTTPADHPMALVGYFDGQGSNQWLRLLDDGEYHLHTDGARLGNGNLLFCASQFLGGGSYDYMAAIDTLGNIHWEKRLDGSGRICVAPWSMADAVVTRQLVGSYGSQLSHLDAMGNVLWTQEIDVRIEEVATFADSLIYLGSLFAQVDDASLLAKLDSNGQILAAWEFSTLLGIRHIRFNVLGEMLLSGEMLVDPQFGLHWQASYGIFRPATQIYGQEGYSVYYGSGMSPLLETTGGYVAAYTDEIAWPPVIRFERRDLQMHTSCDSLANPSITVLTNVANQFPVVIASTTPNPSRILPNLNLTPSALGIQVDCAVSVTNPVEAQVQIFPNPATNVVRVNWQGGEHALRGIQLRNSLGQLVYADMVQGNSAEIDLRPFPAGCYRFTLLDASGYFGSALLIKR